MPKRKLTEKRFDFRGGRNTAVSQDLLDPTELRDATNARLVGAYGAFTKRKGSRRFHTTAFPGAVRGVTQWDVASGKQVVVIAGGNLYYRNEGGSFQAAFTQATTSAVQRSSAAQGTSAGWTDPDGTNDGKNTLTGVAVDASSTVAAGNRLVLTVGDPAANNNRDAVDDLYAFKFKVTANGSALTGTDGFVKATVTLERSVDGGAYAAVGSSYQVIVGVGETSTTEFSVVLTVAGTITTSLTFRPVLTVEVGKASLGTGGTGSGSVQCFNTTFLTDNYPVTWATGAAAFSTVDPAIFAPFRKSTAGAPLVLYIASGGHYFSWDGVSTLTQLDPTNAAPTATSIISYHTRMFAMMASTTIPGLLPKTIAWSKIGDPEFWTVTGLKSDGGAAVTDFLTGQQLTALEVIGSSLLMATVDSVMRFTGQSSDDIVIAQNTEGISAEIGAVGLLALRRFENAAAMLAQRGPYAVTETAAVPIGEKVLPDFDALDQGVLDASIVIYNRGTKELYYIVPSAADGDFNKTIYVYSTRLQTWYGPWTYSFAITSACNWVNTVVDGSEGVLVGCFDGFVRVLDFADKDDVLAIGTGGSNVTMTVELGTLTVPGQTIALNRMALQATLPASSALQIKTAFDGASFTTDNVASAGSDERNYRVDLDGQGKRLRVQFVDATALAPTVHGFTLEAYIYGRP